MKDFTIFFYFFFPHAHIFAVLATWDANANFDGDYTMSLYEVAYQTDISDSNSSSTVVEQ